MLKVLVACVLLVVAATGVIAAKETGVFNSGLPVTLSVPTKLQQSRSNDNAVLPSGHWIKRDSMRFTVSPTGVQLPVRLQVEMTQNGATPQGNPKATGPVFSTSDSSSKVRSQPYVIVRHLRPGTYRWWGRFYNGNAVSSWVPFSSSTAFGVDTTKPSSPMVVSPMDSIQGKTYRSGDITLNWHSSDSGSGISGYWYRFGPSSSIKVTHGHVRTTATTLSLTHEPSGSYTFAVAACDKAGNWSGVSTYHVNLDSTPPQVSGIGFSTFAFNPHYSTMTMNYVVTKPASVRIGIYRSSDGKLVRLVERRATAKGQLLHYTWRGRNNQGQVVAPGTYNFYIRVTDKYHNTSLREFSGLTVINKVIVVSLTQQRLWAYNGHQLLLTSLVTTGNPQLPTPTGTFTILDKRHPFEFISPFPQGDWRYYLPSWVSYAMLFRVGGYYIHDAPWRTVFGPGSNADDGTPGTSYTGTHGCINVPLNVSTALYQWAPDGTPVRVLG